jgi:hypothetical protein
MESTAIDLSWLCLVAVMVLMIPVIYFGTLSRLKYAKRIRDAQARSAFVDMNTPENASRFRRFAFLALIGSLGMIISILMLVQRWVRIPVPFGVLIAAFFVFGIIASVAGFLMKREINRRL